MAKHGDSTELRIVYWGMGVLGLALGSLIFITLAAMSKADAAQIAAGEAKIAAATVATDVVWIKDAVKRIEEKVDEE